MIFIVDDDVTQMQPYVGEFRIRGYEVTQLRHADIAWETLRDVDDSEVELVIMDIMIGAKADASRSRFSSEQTNGFLDTGIYLLADLLGLRPEVFTSKCVLLSIATEREYLEKVGRSGTEFDVPFLWKREYTNAHLLVQKLESMFFLNPGTAQ